MTTTQILILLIVILIVFQIITALIKKPASKPASGKNSQSKINYNYQAQEGLLTAHESGFYKELLPIAKARQLVICPKVRLSDIIKPQKGQNWKAAFNRITSKHVDFVLCRETLKPVVVIELDDRSHERQDRKERDSFVDHALNTAKIPIIHAKNIADVKAKLNESIKV